MSELHFDADGEPARVPADAEELRVRRFRKPGERGACEVVHGADGAPLFVPVDAGYLEFRKLVDNAPGRYRLDPVDTNRRPCSGAVALYVTIEATRNAAAGDDRDSLTRELLRANVEMMRANVEMTKSVTERLSNMMTAAAELVRAADGANLPQRAPAPAPVEDDDDDEDEDDENERQWKTAKLVVDGVNALATKAADLATLYFTMKQNAAAQPAPAPAASVASPPPAPPPVAAPAPAPAAVATEPTAPTTDATDAPAATVPTAAESAAPAAEVRNAAPVAPTAAQIAHLYAARALLSPMEQQVVMTAIPKMPPAVQAHLLGELCALSVEDAAAFVRAQLPPLRAPGAPKKPHATDKKEPTP